MTGAATHRQDDPSRTSAPRKGWALTTASISPSSRSQDPNRLSCLDRPAHPECSPSLATDTTARPAVLRTIVARETRSRGLSGSASDSCHGNPPSDDREPALMLAHRPARPSTRARTYGPAVPIAIIKPRDAARPPNHPPDATTPQPPTERPALARQIPEHMPDGILRAHARSDGGPEPRSAFFASQLNAGGPMDHPHCVDPSTARN